MGVGACRLRAASRLGPGRFCARRRASTFPGMQAQGCGPRDAGPGMRAQGCGPRDAGLFQGLYQGCGARLEDVADGRCSACSAPLAPRGLGAGPAPIRSRDRLPSRPNPVPNLAQAPCPACSPVPQTGGAQPRVSPSPLYPSHPAAVPTAQRRGQPGMPAPPLPRSCGPAGDGGLTRVLAAGGTCSPSHNAAHVTIHARARARAGGLVGHVAVGQAVRALPRGSRQRCR